MEIQQFYLLAGTMQSDPSFNQQRQVFSLSEITRSPEKSAEGEDSTPMEKQGEVHKPDLDPEKDKGNRS